MKVHFMKKLLILILSVILLLAFTACSDDNGDTTQSSDTQSSTDSQVDPNENAFTYDKFLSEISKYVNLGEYNLEDGNYGSNHIYDYTSLTNCEIENKQSNFEIVIDDIKITLPSTVKQLTNLGFTVNYFDSDKTFDFNAKEAKCTLIATTPKGNSVLIRAESKNGESVPIKDLVVIRISCDFYDSTPQYGKNERADTPQIKFFENIKNDSTLESILKELKSPREINFTETKEEGIVTLSAMQFTFYFSNSNYSGSFIATVFPLTDKSVERTDFVFYYTYTIESI